MSPPAPARSDTTALLLPGMTLNATIFPELGLPTLAVEFNDLVLGPSGESPRLAATRMGVYVELLEERLRSAMAWRAARRRIVVAHSFGGMLALAWLLDRTAERDDGVDGVVLVATSAGPMFQQVRLRVLPLGAAGLRVGLAPFMPWWNRPSVTRRVKRLLSGGTLEPQRVDFRALARRSDLALDIAGWRNTDWRAMRSFRIAMDGFDVRERLREIAQPVIVLHGTHDTLIPPAEAELLAAKLPRAELRLVPGAAHGLPLTHGEWVIRAVRDLEREA